MFAPATKCSTLGLTVNLFFLFNTARCFNPIALLDEPEG